jgi:acyl carrier protein
VISDDKIHAVMADIFSYVFLRDDIPISNALSAHDVQGWGSFRQIEIIMACEVAFSMKFTSAEIDRLLCLGDMVEIIARRGCLPASPR